MLVDAFVSSLLSLLSLLESCNAWGVFVFPREDTDDEDVCPNSFPCRGVFWRLGIAGVGTGVEALSISMGSWFAEKRSRWTYLWR